MSKKKNIRIVTKLYCDLCDETIEILSFSRKSLNIPKGWKNFFGGKITICPICEDRLSRDVGKNYSKGFFANKYFNKIEILLEDLDKKDKKSLHKIYSKELVVVMIYHIESILGKIKDSKPRW